MEIKSLPILKCKRCNSEWVPRTINVKACPVCKSRKWMEEKK